MFPSGRGRPSIPPEVIASVIVLQTLHGLWTGSRRGHLRPAWKGCVLDRDRRGGVPPSTLTYCIAAFPPPIV